VSAILNFKKKLKIKRLMAETIIRETKREAQRKAKRCTTRGSQKKKKEKVSPSRGKKLFHPWPL